MSVTTVVKYKPETQQMAVSASLPPNLNSAIGV